MKNIYVYFFDNKRTFSCGNEMKTPQIHDD
jgi:hypothetical protein